VVNTLLDLALLGSNPDRIRRLLQAGEAAIRSEIASGCDPATRWPVDGVRFVTGEELPTGLTSLPDAPPWLFVRGTIPPGPAVAVVGSRRATRYGLELARRIGRTVGGSGWPVVSGLALGVDAAAHEGCLEAGGTAVAVLGSGIDVWYPRGNRRLGERILDSGGAVASEFGPGITPEPWRFPFRNRIISGLASVVIVVEAAVRSGALITAHLAVAHGREVMAVPGDIDRLTSAGCNLLIRDGAHPVTNLDDLVETIEFWLGPAPEQVSKRSGLSTLLPATLDELAAASGMSMTEVMLQVMGLQASGAVQVVDGVIRESGGPSKR
jgi:DNA processing protein